MVESMTAPCGPGFSPQRIVSLTPAATDSLLAFGLGRFLAGAADFRPLPDTAEGIRRVGDPWNARVEDIVGLHPDLVLANAEENPSALIDAVKEAGLRIWVVSPRTVRQAVSDLRDLVLMYASEAMLQSVVWLERSVDWLEGSKPEKRVRVFCPRSREGPPGLPSAWETFTGETYAGDLLSLCGAENVFHGLTYGRYPWVTPEKVAAADPEMILLPDVPFAFGEEDAGYFERELPSLRAVRDRKIRFVDGRLLFWCGSRLGESIRILPELFRSNAPR
jgi:ABC-type Fe3+-hydroxamate transport system substrate-binding protein